MYSLEYLYFTFSSIFIENVCILLHYINKNHTFLSTTFLEKL